MFYRTKVHAASNKARVRQLHPVIGDPTHYYYPSLPCPFLFSQSIANTILLMVGLQDKMPSRVLVELREMVLPAERVLQLLERFPRLDMDIGRSGRLNPTRVLA